MRWLSICVLVLLARPAVAVEKFALAVYHFNVQYVQGGLIGFPDGESMSDTFNVTDEQAQDRVITESFEPLLDVYARHPDWGADFEMQGYMLDVIVQRHPGVLAKMKTLAQAGKVSFDSFHWSDQFWIAYPRVDMERSHDLVIKSFHDAGIPLGTSIFTQEGQFGSGMERFFRERGIRTAIVAGGVVGSTLNLPAAPLNTLGPTQDVLAVVAPCGGSPCDGPQDDKVQVLWDWRDDGELTTTGSGNPYLGTAFTYKPELTAQYEQRLVDEETNGFKHVSVEHFVDRALELGEQPTPLPQLVDGVWHHDVFLWMGGMSLEDALVPGTSADNTVHTLAMKAHRKVRQAEEAVATLKITGFETQLDHAWRELLLGECSDGSGQNPWLGERQYSLKHSQEALDTAEAILKDNRVASKLVSAPPAPKLVDDVGPLQPIVYPDTHRPAHVKWQKREGTEVWELTATFDGIEDPSRDLQARRLQLDFPRTGDNLIWSEALEDEKVLTMPLAGITGTDVQLPDGGTAVTAMIPAANGLVGLGGGLYLIKRMETVHVAAQLPRDESLVRFKDDTADTGVVTWKFLVVKGSEADALAVAKATNVDPDPLGPPPAKPKGCGCGMTAGDAGAGLFALLGLFGRRRRFRR